MIHKLLRGSGSQTHKPGKLCFLRRPVETKYFFSPRQKVVLLPKAEYELPKENWHLLFPA